MLDSEPKDKQKVARRVARGNEMRSALLIMLLGHGGGVPRAPSRGQSRLLTMAIHVIIHSLTWRVLK